MNQSDHDENEIKRICFTATVIVPKAEAANNQSSLEMRQKFMHSSPHDILLESAGLNLSA